MAGAGLRHADLRIFTYAGLLAWVGAVAFYLMGKFIHWLGPKKLSPDSLAREERSLERQKKAIKVVQVFIFVSAFLYIY